MPSHTGLLGSSRKVEHPVLNTGKSQANWAMAVALGPIVFSFLAPFILLIYPRGFYCQGKEASPNLDVFTAKPSNNPQAPALLGAGSVYSDCLDSCLGPEKCSLLNAFTHGCGRH